MYVEEPCLSSSSFEIGWELEIDYEKNHWYEYHTYI